MFELSIQLGDLTRVVNTSSQGIDAGQSYIHALSHPMLEHCVWKTDGKVALYIREKGRKSLKGKNLSESGFQHILQRAKQWPLQYALAVLDLKKHRIEISQGEWGVAPVYFVEKDDRLEGHWDPLQLYKYVKHVDIGRAARFLRTFDMPYGLHTLFSDLKLLTAETQLTWGNGVPLSFKLPVPITAPVARRLRQGAQPIDMALDILRQSLVRWIHPGICYGSELSGGLDSSLISILVSEHVKPLKTFGLALQGTYGQEKRRSDLIQAFPFSDYCANLAEHLPYAEISPRWLHGVVPWEETYDEAVSHLLSRAREDGVQVMFTGFGGDELCPLYPGEDPPPSELLAYEPASETLVEADFLMPEAIAMMRETPIDAAPQGAIDASSVETAAFGSALYLRHGIWPVHPFCTPQLVRFCQSLPWKWRVGRTIERRMLSQVGCPKSVFQSSTIDSFLPSLAAGMRGLSKDKIQALFKAPKLVSLGLVDGKNLCDQFQEWCERGGDEEVIPFYSAVSLELALNQIKVDS